MGTSADGAALFSIYSGKKTKDLGSVCATWTTPTNEAEGIALVDDARFDTWTRRRFGQTAGSVLASIIGLGVIEMADAQNTRRSKRCRKLFAGCKPGKKPKCCKHLQCFPDMGGSVCCKSKGRPCTPVALREECCPGFVCDITQEISVNAM